MIRVRSLLHRLHAWLAPAGLAFCLALPAGAAPLPVQSLPDPLKSWVPWVMQGHEMLACPRAHNAEVAADAEDRACIWPSLLALDATGSGASFRFEVQVFGPPGWVELPGEPGRWPRDVKADAKPLAVGARDGRPAVLLPAGSHVLSGRIDWPAMPQDLLLPRALGSLQLNIQQKPAPRSPDAEGRVWLQATEAEAQATDALTVRTARLVDDDIPLRLRTRIDLAVSGRAREIALPAALLPGFVAESLDSPLPARLGDDGSLRVQVRPGNWSLDVSGRRMQPTAALGLPAGSADEVWSFAAHNELRVVSAEGLPAIDPKQVTLPDAWRRFPAYAIKAGQTLKLVESRRGDPDPAADRLTLARQIWLDFNGQGYTLQDRIGGKLSRSWRLEMAAPAGLGRAAADGQDQPVTRRAGASADGIELRRGTVQLVADSRIDSATRELPAAGWQADFNSAKAQLHLPPGWRLLHASGVDQAQGSWLSQWSLWDFFFVLLGCLAAARLLGLLRGGLLAGALLLTWHMPGAPQSGWLLLIALLALTRVLPAGRLLNASTWASQLCAGVLALWLLPYAVQQIRLSIYPALEHPGQQVADGSGELARPQQEVSAMAEKAAAPVEAPAPAEVGVAPPAPAPAAEPRAMSRAGRGGVYNSAPPASVALDEIDPGQRVQTGPGLPAWQWNSHQLSWQGPLQSAQSLHLWLLPPWGTVVLRLGGLALMVAALWALATALPGWPKRGDPSSEDADGAARPGLSAGVAAGVLALAPALLLAAMCCAALPAWAKQAAPAAPTPVATPGEAAGNTPDAALLDELRQRLTTPPDCLPQCADVARLRVEAQGSRVQLRLEIHAQADVSLPLPGQGANWRPTLVTVDGRPATTRRGPDGALYLAARAGVSQVLLMADVGNAASVEIALPMPPREVTAQAEGWTLGGLDARGLASGALSLTRSGDAGSGSAGRGEGGTQRDALAPFLRIERTLHLGLRWTVDTRVTRIAPSRAPARARIKLLDGEAVNSEGVRVEDGHALLQLGNEETATFTSTVRENAKLALRATSEPNQIEVWRLDPSAQWHVGWGGIAPVQYVDGASGRLQPSWQPWPGETVTVEVSKPAGSGGQTLTIDRLNLSVSPGLRATDVSSLATVRSSQGANHRVELPEGVEFLGLSIDGAVLPVQPRGRELQLPLAPGEHRVKIDWREPRGIGWWFETPAHGLGMAGVNATTTLKLPGERVLLAVGGPRVGPAVLFWGVLFTLAGVAWALGRSRLTPLRAGAWFLLGLGLAQVSLLGAVLVAGWFFALAARERAQPQQLNRGAFNVMQVLLVLWTLLAFGCLLDVVQTGLLGYPDLMVTGNGSTASELNWFQDRFSADADAPLQTAWVVSIPLLAYRLLMLVWALWLALAVLRWVRWGWGCYSSGGYWRRGEPKAAAPAAAPAAPADPFA